jgi:hypothetical protein
MESNETNVHASVGDGAAARGQRSRASAQVRASERAVPWSQRGAGAVWAKEQGATMACACPLA